MIHTQPQSLLLEALQQTEFLMKPLFLLLDEMRSFELALYPITETHQLNTKFFFIFGKTIIIESKKGIMFLILSTSVNRFC